MSDLDALLASLPIDSLAAQVGESPDAVRQAAGVALPALLGGLHANAEGGGADSLLEALAQHESGDGTQVDAAEGAQIAAHIFGANQDQVVSQLGSTGVPSGLLQKLIPLLAPIVMAWLAKQMTGKGAAPSAGGGSDVLGQVLGQVLGGATGGAGGSGGAGGLAGSILGNVLGGLLGGGRK